MTITTHPTRNCNVIYLDNLLGYEGRPEAAMLSAFTNKVPQYYAPDKQDRLEGAPTFTKYNCGILMFAHGSEHKTNKYGHQFAAFIREQHFGELIELPPIPNPLHANKPAVLFLWIVDWKAVHTWWNAQDTAQKQLAAKNQL